MDLIYIIAGALAIIIVSLVTFWRRSKSANEVVVKDLGLTNIKRKDD